MRRLCAISLILAGCTGDVSRSPEGTPSIEASPTVAPPTEGASPSSVGEAERITGEVVFDGGWPSEYREGCLSIVEAERNPLDRDFVELITADEWTMTHDAETGWFEIRDATDTIIVREHRLATVIGRRLEGPGCREGTLFEVTGFEPPPKTAATLYVEVVGGIGSSEGSVNVVRILDDDGRPLMQQPVGGGERVEIPAGEITILDFQKSCDGNCGMAYGAYAPCEEDLDVEPGDELTITIILDLGGCELLTRDGVAADVVGVIDVAPFDGTHGPYGLSRCVRVADGVVPVLPEGWTIELTEPQPDVYEVAVIDPTGDVVARNGDILWLDGTLNDDDPMPFGCDYGVLLLASEVVQTRARSP